MAPPLPTTLSGWPGPEKGRRTKQRGRGVINRGGEAGSAAAQIEAAAQVGAQGAGPCGGCRRWLELVPAAGDGGRKKRQG